MAVNHGLTAMNFIISGYNDYIAARVLFQNELYQAGTVLASSAVEKYLKSLLTALKIEVKRLHLDKFADLKKQFDNTSHQEIFNYFDSSFFLVLGTAYSFRYLDNIKEPKTIGFFSNQFIGELDFTIACFERLINFEIQPGKPWVSPYQKAVENNDHRIWNSNYILNNIVKEDFMKRESEAFGLHYEPSTNELLTISFAEHKKKLPVEYEGKIMLLQARYG